MRLVERYREEDRYGERLPVGMGVAWRDWMLREVVLMPIPLNWVAGWVRCLFFSAMSGYRQHETEILKMKVADMERQDLRLRAEVHTLHSEKQDLVRVLEKISNAEIRIRRDNPNA